MVAWIGTPTAAVLLHLVFQIAFHVAIGLILISLGFNITLMTAFDLAATTQYPAPHPGFAIMRHT